MPWCTTCDRFLNPPTVGADGTCPTCGHEVEPYTAADDAEPMKMPWHLKAILGALALYLGYRTFEMLEWVFRKAIG